MIHSFVIIQGHISLSVYSFQNIAVDLITENDTYRPYRLVFQGETFNAHKSRSTDEFIGIDEVVLTPCAKGNTDL